MKKIFLCSLMFIVTTLSIGCSDKNTDNSTNGSTGNNLPAKLPTKTNDINLYTHYMPWFETPATNNGKWGYHWTMVNRDPNVIDANGQREIASYYYPLTGPYASSDPDILDYQCLLMKYSGIDGVMIDWYGTQTINDYASNKTNTEAMVNAVVKAGLKFAIVYEDATLSNASDMVTQAREDMTYLGKGFFKNPNYVTVDGKPLLLDFGPQQMQTPKDWFRTFSILTNTPEFIVLNGHTQYANDGSYANSQGEFSWVNPNPDYSVAKNFPFYIGGAMPGFHDYYSAGGVGSDYPTYDSANGALFQNQLDAVKNANLSWLQISTWNDYGEGTNIEPTKEYGYQYLTALQKYTGVTYTQTELELIYRWYNVCVAHPNDPKVNQAYQYLNSLQPDKAEPLIVDLEK